MTAVTPTNLRVDLGDRGYDILIGPRLIEGAGAAIAERHAGARLVVLSDAAVAGLHLDRLMASLNAAGLKVAAPIIVPSGEHSKDWATLGFVLEELLARGIERRTLLLALGGGVVGDLGGFAAAIALRGIDFIQVPTTLLAQVDSSVGGKTGINSAHGKNLIGSFHQPRLVLADTDVLNTLPRRELLAGYAEVVKYACLGDAPFMDWLEAHGAAVLAGDTGLRAEAIRRCCAAKANIVARDEREGGLRELLNLGHTFGHALEAEAGYGTALLHGEAVAIGMVMAFDLSVRMGLCSAIDAARLHRHLSSVGLPTGAAWLKAAAPAGDWRAETLLAHTAKDKKMRDGKVTFILARGIGQAFRCRDVEPADALAVFATALGN